jgi:hypothetical protein
MVGARKVASVAALLVFAGLIVRAVNPGSPLTQGRFETSMWFLMVPLGLTALGVFRERAWGRWLALGAAVAVLPWAAVLTATPFMARAAPVAALVACLVLLVSLTGPTVAERFEGPDRIPLISWTIICNVASVLVLYLFVGAYDYPVGWHAGVTGALLLALILGTLRLAAGKTLGLLVVGLCAALLVPTGSYFVAREAVHAGEAFLLVAVFLPGILTAAACIARFGRPIWQVLRD